MMMTYESIEPLRESVPAAVHTKALVKEYPGGDGVHGLDLSIAQGSFFGLIGPNGAGKSTTIKILMGLLKPTSGDATVLGSSVLAESDEVRRQVGYVPEQHYMYPWMTVNEILWFTRAFYPSWDHNLCRELVSQYELDGSKKVKELSHGMRTKLALILALSHVPKLLLLDEPTTGLDPIIREEFLSGLKLLLERQSCTILLSSHIMSDVEKVADTIGIINKGRLLMCAPREELLAHTKRLRITEKEPSCALPVAGAILEERQAGYRCVTVGGFSREFLSLTRQRMNGAEIDVIDLSLEEILKDYIKGARAAC